MTGNRAAGVRILALALLASAAAVGLSACGSIDEALFGGGTPSEAQPAAEAGGAPGGAEAAAPPGAEEQAAAPQEGATQGGEAQAAPAPATAAISPIPIESGGDTGTAVGRTIQSQRAEVSTIESKMVADAQRFADLKNQAGQQAATYHEDKAHISVRLQVGTTRGNPELVSEWNSAQSALDSLTGNINALNALGTDISNDSSRAHYELATIQATFNVSGAVDEDHRQLSVLEDETSQIIVTVDRLLRDVSQDVARETAYVGNERADLTRLSSAIRNGEFYQSELGNPELASAGPAIGGGSPLLTIRFGRAHVDYTKRLYSALSQALQAQPSASFSVVAVSPTRGSAGAVRLSQAHAQRHAQDVMRMMTRMGVPATRLAISSSTDPSVATGEVRVYAR